MSQRMRVWSGIIIFVVGVLFVSPLTHAETLQSPNYKFDEPTLGADSTRQSSSANYSAISGTGDVGVSNSSSNSFQVNAGSNTSPDPVLSIAITSTMADFGILSPSATATATSTFSVLNYTSYGYAVQITGNAPTSGAHTISPMTTTAIAQPGIEQFGINLVANTSPKSFGSNPDNGSFGFGIIGSGPGDMSYSTPNEFRYVSGETIASAPKSSGQTNYTISYIVNTSSITPGGRYTSDQTVIVTGTY